MDVASAYITRCLMVLSAVGSLESCQTGVLEGSLSYCRGSVLQTLAYSELSTTFWNNFCMYATPPTVN